MKRVVITGEPYSGKTTLINYFSKKYQVVPESAIIIINKLIKKLGLEKQKKMERKTSPRISNSGWYRSN